MRFPFKVIIFVGAYLLGKYGTIFIFAHNGTKELLKELEVYLEQASKH